MNRYETKAYAKINLSLDVIGRRENGYHDVCMVMQTVGLYDEISIEKISDEEIRVEVEDQRFFKDDALPKDKEGNLCYKAAKMLKERFELPGGMRIYMKKRIPVAAGLAGGSTDAAAVFRGINQLYNLRLTKEELCKLGVELGADIPYCILGGTYLSEGIGEILTPITPTPKAYLVLVKPPVAVSTKLVYEALDSKEDFVHPNTQAMLKAISNGDLKAMSAFLCNVLESVTIPMHPEILTLKEKLLECGALNAIMSGSGPTVFGIFESQEEADLAKNEILKRNLSKEVFAIPFIENIEE